MFSLLNLWWHDCSSSLPLDLCKLSSIFCTVYAYLSYGGPAAAMWQRHLNQTHCYYYYYYTYLWQKVLSLSFTPSLEAQNYPFSKFSLTSQLSDAYLRNETWHRQPGNGVGNYTVNGKNAPKCFLFITSTKTGHFWQSLVYSKFAIQGCKRFTPHLNNASKLTVRVL